MPRDHSQIPAACPTPSDDPVVRLGRKLDNPKVREAVLVALAKQQIEGEPKQALCVVTPGIVADWVHDERTGGLVGGISHDGWPLRPAM